MFEKIASGISQLFSDVMPHTFCIGCFLKGLAEGAVLGLATVAIVASLPADLAIAATIGLAALGVYGMSQLAKNWGGMSDGAKSEAMGNVLGSFAGGFAGAKMVAPVETPGVQLLESPEGETLPVLTGEGEPGTGAVAETGAEASGSGSVGGLPEGVTNVNTISAEEANAPFVDKGWSPPYAEGTDVTKFTTTEDTPQQFARVHTADNQQGAFLVRSEDIAGMNADQIQQHLALPSKPTSISDVTVPSGTNMQMGTVAAQPGFGAPNVGGTQYQLLNPIPASSFTNTRPLP